VNHIFKIQETFVKIENIKENIGAEISEEITKKIQTDLIYDNEPNTRVHPKVARLS
jgi:hypothetical protein